MTRLIAKIVSGGQSGADRAALDVAIELGIDHGGWVPRGRWAEDGPLATRYQMQEAESAQPAERTEWNVRDADATLIFSHGAPTGGTARNGKLRTAAPEADPVHQSGRRRRGPGGRQIVAWLRQVRPKVLNVAGPRASNDPLIYDAVSRVLRRVLESE